MTVTVTKTRCNNCYNENKKATEEPCASCSEIQHSLYSKDDNFLDASKNLLKGE